MTILPGSESLGPELGPEVGPFPFTAATLGLTGGMLELDPLLGLLESVMLALMLSGSIVAGVEGVGMEERVGVEGMRSVEEVGVAWIVFTVPTKLTLLFVFSCTFSRGGSSFIDFGLC